MSNLIKRFFFINAILLAFFCFKIFAELDDSIFFKENKNIEKIYDGTFNVLWKINNNGKILLLRQKKDTYKFNDFNLVINAAKEAYKYNIGVFIYDTNIAKRQMLIEYINHIPWPDYQKKPLAYKKAIKALKTFHTKIKIQNLKKDFAPFSFIIKKAEELNKKDILPYQFSIALKRFKNIFHILKAWIDKNSTTCHGDFHTKNVLLSNDNVFLIDFDMVNNGDPFFDFAKFTSSLKEKEQLELFEAYLGHLPSNHELLHLKLVKLASLMISATTRFFFAYENIDNEKLLSKKQLEKMLNKKKLPSHKTISFNNQDPKKRQLAAIFALHEFLAQYDAFFNSFKKS